VAASEFGPFVALPENELVPECFLARFSDRRCEGRLVRAHLYEKQALRRRGCDPWDERSWVWACGGPTGLGGHHGLFDAHRLVVPPEELPVALLALAHEIGGLSYLERRYGYRRVAA